MDPCGELAVLPLKGSFNNYEQTKDPLKRIWLFSHSEDHLTFKNKQRDPLE